jgi:hypothetical protein
LFLHKKQQKALDSHVKALTQEEKKGECFDKFGINNFEKCIYVAI